MGCLVLWQEGQNISFPPLGNGGYNSNQDVPYLSVTLTLCQCTDTRENSTTNCIVLQGFAVQMSASYCVRGKKCIRNIVTYPMPHKSHTVLVTMQGQKEQYLQSE